MSTFYTAVARFYDAENQDNTDDLAMYSRLAADCGGGILDVGCGTGRILLPLAQQGHVTHGIESDRAMLDQLERKLAAQPQLRGRVHYVYADACDYEFDLKFRLTLLSFNALMHFHEQEAQIRLLRQLRRGLAADGILLIDLPNAGPAFATEDSDSMIFERKFLDPATGNFVMLHSLSALDRTAQILHVDWIYDIINGDGALKRVIATHRLRYYFLAELRLLLERCGFAIAAVYGDTEQGAFTSESERMIVHARPV